LVNNIERNQIPSFKIAHYLLVYNIQIASLPNLAAVLLALAIHFSLDYHTASIYN
jgi:hypothetical protein